MTRFPQTLLFLGVVLFIFAASSATLRTILFYVSILIAALVVWMIAYIVVVKSVKPSLRTMVRDGLTGLVEPRDGNAVIFIAEDVSDADEGRDGLRKDSRASTSAKDKGEPRISGPAREDGRQRNEPLGGGKEQST